MSEGIVGIIANPASGKDIRRLVAHGSTFDNNEKINIVRRVLLGLDAVGVRQAHFMPDAYAIVPRAVDNLDLRLDLVPLPMPTLGNPGDTLEAAKRLADLNAGCIVTLGGDGTNRMVTKGCKEVPLVPISTGTNNVFPRMVEGTLAGLAAGLIATGGVSNASGTQRVIHRAPRLDVSLDGEVNDLALIDVVTTRRSWIGARALWDPAHLSEIVLSRVTPSEIGMCSLGGVLFPNECDTCSGVHIVVGAGERHVVAPLAPGLIRQVPIAAASLVKAGGFVDLGAGRCTVALDGEREFEVLHPDQRLRVSLNPQGPRVVDIDAALRAGAEAGLFVGARERHA